MASQTYEDAKKKRDSAERKREAAQRIINDPNKSAAQKAAARQRRDANAATMREQGNIMRAETGREKGQRTTYTGPIGVEARTERGLPAETDWQKVNLRWLQDIQAANPNWTITQARNELKRMFADDRPGYLAEQQRRMDAGEKVEFPEGDVVTSVDGPVRGSGVGGPGLLGPFSPGGRMPAGYGGYGGYPVLSLGTPSGLSYPAAAEAAEGYAGALGFNIGPEGGLVYRPWEARAWQQTGIDPNLWNAPFAGGGLLGGGYPGSGRPGTGVGGTGTTAGINVPGTGATTGTTTTTPTNPFAVDPTAWHAPYADIQSGFVFNPVLAAGGQDEFMQWTRWKHQQNQAANAAKWTDPDAVDQFAFENLKAGPLARAAADQARENAFLQGSAAVVPTSAAYVDPAAQFQARQSALAAEREAAAPAVVQPFVDPAAHFQAQQSALAAARAAAATRQKISAYTGAGQAQHEQGLAPGLLGTARSPHVTWT